MLVTREERNQLVAQARAMRDMGIKNAEIAQQLNVTRRAVSHWLIGRRPDPRAAVGRKTEHPHAVSYRCLLPSEADVRARFAEIPKYDNRSLIGQIVGDPLFERSALAAKLEGRLNDRHRHAVIGGQRARAYPR